ncbi:gamma-glutamyl-gamma-aminobutyrate hydrolase family protein [Lachnoanaerobaculum gingivalis]|uniref:Gamma-glutamyl-gamma-aminobutyrate hydrolase family protein n=1 Tax=Lachnoanaerobaculum gingivalis TaxID=2490855 RepID=A0A3P3QTI1_9FIRM|nr:gamma-glutamyl-gamma-aminobutyrate hydrolase family protein [Lachnoanaerobaculum gingivalis]RRJ24557.1 gamma-glutamyl-gamma-aminobutyrate hydrolase family protein [Lachnoanaerobaculum gingivalis]
MKKVALAGTESLTNYIDALKENDIEVIATLDVDEAIKCDGLLLPGGGDIDPVYYGEEMNGSDEPDRELDKAQRDILDAFVKAKKPILGICRGMQLINIYFGGSLHQDLVTRDIHTRKNGNDSIHSVKSVEEGNLFEKFYGKIFNINSAHHQGTKKLGKGLKEVLRSDDGVCEAVIHEELPIIATQFHPERMSYKQRRDDAVVGEEIFKYFKSLLK